MFGGEVEDIEKTAEETPQVSEGRIKRFQVKKKKQTARQVLSVPNRGRN